MKEKLIILFLLLLGFLISHTSQAQIVEKENTLSAKNQTNSYKIFDVKKNSVLTLQQLIDNISAHQIIFFGEEHNDSIGHHLQNEVFSGLYKINQNLSLSLEMFVSDDQLVVDEYLNGTITIKNFMKDVSLWNNYKDYKPMVEFAKSNHLSVLAANAPSRYTNLVTREGLNALNFLSKQALGYLAPLPIDTLTGRYYNKFMELLGSHGDMSSRIYHSQNVWDATMAHFIYQHHQQRPQNTILHLCGRFHSDEFLGTVAQLRKLNGKIDIVVISSFSSDDYHHPDWEKHKVLGDYIIITDPELPRSY